MKGLKGKSFLASIGLIIIMLSAIMVIFAQHEAKAELETIYATDSNGLTWRCRKGENELYDLSFYTGSYDYTNYSITIPEKITYEGKEYTVRTIGYVDPPERSLSTGGGYSYYPAVPNSYYIRVVNLPSTLIAINNSAFRKNSYITTITIPGSVKAIGQGAFDSCTSLSSLTFEEGVSGIETYQNFNNTALTSVTIPGSMKTTPEFSGSSRLEKVTCLDGVETCSLYNLAGLKEVVLADSVKNTSISYCNALEKATIGESMTPESIQRLAQINSLKQILTTETTTKYKSIDGVIYSNDEKTIYAWPAGKQVTNLVIPEQVTEIYKNTFRYAKGVSGTITFNDNLEKIGDYAFCNDSYYQASQFTGELNFNSKLKSIGNYAFCRCNGLTGNLEFPESLVSIGANAFESCTGFTGDLIIPDNIVSIGSSSFYGCSGINGQLVVGEGITRINTRTFNGINNFKKVTIGSNVTAVEKNAFNNLTDIYALSPKGTIKFAEQYCTPSYPFVHYNNCIHRLTVNVADGVKLINTTTNQEIDSGYYECETSFRYKVQVPANANYQNLKLVVIDNDDVDNAQILDIAANTEYDFAPIIRDRKIYVQPISSGLDLTLRTFITEVNGKEPLKSRVPILKYGTTIDYRHTKYPVRVDEGDNVVYTIRVYNEGKNNGKATEVKAYVPNGITVNLENETNAKYGWELVENGIYKTTYLADKTIDGNIGSGVLDCEDVKLSIVVSEDSLESDLYKMIFAEISGEEGIEGESDNDSTTNNVAVSENYRLEDIINSNAYSYIRGQEDDDDFDTVVLNAKIKVKYSIKIDKADKDTGELIKGAKFELRSFGENDLIMEDENANEILRTYTDGELISTAVSDENGVVEFDNITSYNEGENNFYIIETETAEGYLLDSEKQLKIKVIKKIIDEKLGTYEVSVYSEVSSHDIDTSNYKFIPITNALELSKIGSGETLTVNGKEYEFAADKNYQLQNDIDLSGINWTPISNEYAGIFDGNNHKIKNLTITANDEMNISEIGLFSSFTGIVRNLTMENPYIDIKSFSSEAITYSGYTGVGSIAGVMYRGYIFNCKTTITEEATAGIFAEEDNVGGLIGHTTPQGLVTIENCENNVSVGAKEDVPEGILTNNAGGLIGCSLGSLEIKNSTNNGKIRALTYNAGGLVGFAQSDNYQDLFVTVQYEDKINLLVQNEAAKGKYNLILENRESTTNELIPGAVYEIDKGNNNKQIELLKTGNLKLFDKIIEYAGKDIYFLSEEESAKGYSNLDRIVRVDVERYWDEEAEEYKVRAEAALISKEEYQSFTGSQETKESESKTGKIADEDKIFTDTDLVTANWNTKKIAFTNCVNNAEVKCDFMNAAGIIGTTYGDVTINDCTNNAEVKSGAKAAGIISELRAVSFTSFDAINGKNNFRNLGDPDLSIINNCTNNANISTDNIDTYGSIGGIVGESIGFVTIKNAVNDAMVRSAGYQHAGGIVGQAYGAITIEDSINNKSVYSIFDVEANDGKINAGYASTAGGILAHLNINEDKLETLEYDNTKAIIKKCENHGDIKATSYVGGILAQAAGKEISIKDCKVSSLNENEKIAITSIERQNRAGIVAASMCKNNMIENCSVERIKISPEEENLGSYYYYGAAAGIMAELQSYFYADSSTSANTKLESLDILNCSVKDSELMTKNQETAGIFAKVYDGNSLLIVNIKDCSVEKTIVNHEILGSTTYMGAAGIALFTMCKELTIDNCKVENSIVKQATDNEEIGGAAMNAGGILGKTMYGNSIKVLNCEVKDSQIIANCKGWNTAGGVGGVIGNIHNPNGDMDIENCKIENSRVYTHYNNIGGLIGEISAYGSHNAVIKNCDVIETSVIRKATEEDGYNYDEVGGFAGWLACSVEIDNCNVIGKDVDKDDPEKSEERTIVSSETGCVGGFIGSLYDSPSHSIKNSKVKNIDVYNNVHTAFYAELGGVVGYARGSSSLYEDVSIEECNIIGNETKNVGGILGIDQGTVKFKNCDVDNCNIVSKTTLETNPGYSSVYGVVGGIGGYISSAEMEECNVTNSTISCGHHAASGGIAISDSVDAKNCNVKNTKVLDNWIEENEETALNYVAGYRSWAGFVGHSNSISLENIKVEKLTCENKYGFVGGIAAEVYGISKLKNCEVIESTLKLSKSTNNNSGSTGGMIGNVGGNISGEVSNNKVKDTNITVTNHNVGGIFGRSPAGVTITDCEVNKVKITHQNNQLVITNEPSRPTIFGGIVGIMTTYGYNNTDTLSTIKDSKIIDCEFVSENPDDIELYMGGALGFAMNSITIDNVEVLNTAMNNKTNGITGGLVGLMNNTDDSKTLTVSNSSVKGTSLTGKGHAGGIVGVAGLGNISDTEVKDTTITAERTAGGIAAIHEGTFTNCTVDGTTITANTEHAGGIAGCTKGSIAGSIVKNSTIEVKAATHTELNTETNTEEIHTNCLGGIVGAGKDNTPTITESTVENNTLNKVNASISGKYIGAPDTINNALIEAEE